MPALSRLAIGVSKGPALRGRLAGQSKGWCCTRGVQRPAEAGHERGARHQMRHPPTRHRLHSYTAAAVDSTARFNSRAPVLSPNAGVSTPTACSALSMALAMGVPSAAFTCRLPLSRPPA